MALVKIVEAPQAALVLVEDLKEKLDPNAVRAVNETYLQGVDSKMVKVLKGRNEYQEIEHYLEEIPAPLMARVKEVLDAMADGVRYESILGGKGWQFLSRMTQRYPILIHAKAAANAMRANRRADKALDRLETISETAESESAQVKACEVMLRATHPAFGHATEEKVGSSRPLITINIGAIYGQNVENLRKNAEEVVELPNS